VGLPRLSKIWRAFTDWIVAIAERVSGENLWARSSGGGGEGDAGFREGLLRFDRSGGGYPSLTCSPPLGKANFTKQPSNLDDINPQSTPPYGTF